MDMTEADPTKEQIVMYTKRLCVPYTSATLNKERTVNIVVPWKINAALLNLFTRRVKRFNTKE